MLTAKKNRRERAVTAVTKIQVKVPGSERKRGGAYLFVVDGGGKGEKKMVRGRGRRVTQACLFLSIRFLKRGGERGGEEPDSCHSQLEHQKKGKGGCQGERTPLN